MILPWIESSNNVGANKHPLAFPLQQQGGVLEHLWNKPSQMCQLYSKMCHRHKIDEESRSVFDLTKAVFYTVATLRVGPCDCTTGADDTAGTTLETTFIVEY